MVHSGSDFSYLGRTCAWCREPLDRTARRNTLTCSGRCRRAKSRSGGSGVTKERHDELLLSQGGVCAICERPPPKGRSLVIDHCRSTGRVRGLLCYSCNFLIGKLGDTVESATKVLDYLATA